MCLDRREASRRVVLVPSDVRDELLMLVNEQGKVI